MGKGLHVRLALRGLCRRTTISQAYVVGPLWASYTSSKTAVLQLQGDNVTMIPDTYRATQIAFINTLPAIFYH